VKEINPREIMTRAARWFGVGRRRADELLRLTCRQVFAPAGFEASPEIHRHYPYKDLTRAWQERRAAPTAQPQLPFRLRPYLPRTPGVPETKRYIIGRRIP